jgi:membrane associated rhomboid family serine protease
MNPFPHSHRPLPRGLVVLAATIALIEIVLALADAGLFADPSLRRRVFVAGAFWASLLHGDTPLFAAQPITMFVSHAFLHGSLLHMAMNLTILLALGRFTADRYGPGTAVPVFLLTAIAGGAVFGLLSDDRLPMVGASGAVFGFFGVWIAWDWRRHRAAGASAGPVVRRVLALAFLNLLLWFALAGGLAWQAHLGGFLAGLACGAWFEARIDRDERAARAQRRRERDAAGE